MWGGVASGLLYCCGSGLPAAKSNWRKRLALLSLHPWKAALRMGRSILPRPMTADPLTPAVSERICRHMNDDHASAVLAYARHFAGLTEAQSARMVAVGPEAMTLEVDGSAVAVPFDHPLRDSEDAHRTLVAMLRSISGNP